MKTLNHKTLSWFLKQMIISLGAFALEVKLSSLLFSNAAKLYISL